MLRIRNILNNTSFLCFCMNTNASCFHLQLQKQEGNMHQYGEFDIGTSLCVNELFADASYHLYIQNYISNTLLHNNVMSNSGIFTKLQESVLFHYSLLSKCDKVKKKNTKVTLCQLKTTGKYLKLVVYVGDSLQSVMRKHPLKTSHRLYSRSNSLYI